MMDKLCFVCFIIVGITAFEGSNALDNTTNSNQILSWEAPKEFAKRYPYYVSGYDFSFRPVVIWDFGRWDIRSLVEKGGRDFEIYKNYSQQFVTRMQNLKSPFQEADDGIVLLLDAEGFGWKQVTHFETVRYMLRESLKLEKMASNVHRGIVINANAVMINLIDMVKLFQPKELDNLSVFGTNSTEWMPELLKSIPRDQLPPWYGGYDDFVPAEVFG